MPKYPTREQFERFLDRHRPAEEETPHAAAARRRLRDDRDRFAAGCDADRATEGLLSDAIYWLESYGDEVEAIADAHELQPLVRETLQAAATILFWEALRLGMDSAPLIREAAGLLIETAGRQLTPEEASTIRRGRLAASEVIERRRIQGRRPGTGAPNPDEHVPDPLTESETCVLATLKEIGPGRWAGVELIQLRAGDMGMRRGESTTKNAVKKLCEIGLAERPASGKGCRITLKGIRHLDENPIDRP
jgi:hypothetical protein